MAPYVINQAAKTRNPKEVKSLSDTLLISVATSSWISSEVPFLYQNIITKTRDIKSTNEEIKLNGSIAIITQTKTLELIRINKFFWML